MLENKKFQENPYVSARREWNERYGDFIQSAHHWRRIAFGSMTITLLAVCGLIWIAGQHKIIPFAVEFDKYGEITRVTRAAVASTPNDRQMMAALRNWIIGARTIYTDTQAQEAILDKTYSMVSPESACHKMLLSYHQANNPFKRSEKETVTVDIHAIIPLSPFTWQIEWTEHTKQLSGSGSKHTHKKAYQAAITVELLAPSTEDTILLNPLGIFAKYCSWTKRL